MATDPRSEVLDALKARGIRLTAPRRAVIEVLTDSSGHPSAQQLARRAQRLHPQIHLATVYRALDTLCAAGLVAHTHLASGTATYHLTAPSAPLPHAHVECTNCHAVLDIDPSWLDQIAEHLHGELGFSLVPHHAALLGLCRDCRPE